MKKYISMIMAAITMVGLFSACSNASNVSAKTGNSAVNSETVGDAGKIQIVTTIFPEYDWVMNIVGDNNANVEVTMLLDNGVDLHSFQPTADDILKISTCDLFVYVGGESDEWVEDALLEATNKDMVVINLLDELGGSVKEEEVVEGMQEDDDHDHEHETEEDADDHDHEGVEDTDDHEDGEIEYDEHVWLSLRNAEVLVQSISDSIQSIDPDNKEIYISNTSAYISELSLLDEKYSETVKNSSYDTLLFGDRFPFRYLVDDYDLNYYAAFVGCSAETEASFETIAFLSQKIDELSLPAVMTIEGTDQRIAETVVSSTRDKDQQILTMDSMQAITSSDIQSGVTYLSIMEKNLEVLTKALND